MSPFTLDVGREFGASSHVRMCIVEKDGTVDATNELRVSSWTWAMFILRTVVAGILGWLWGLVTLKACCAGRRGRRCCRSDPSGAYRRAPNLLSSHQLQQLLDIAVAEGTLTCRFDELLRDVRLLAAHNSHKVDDRGLGLYVESLFRRFAPAVSTVTTKELMSRTYHPKPIDTSAVKLPLELAQLCDILANQSHEVWARSRVADGWSHGASRDNVNRLHPDLVPFEMLSEDGRAYDRDSSKSTLQCILELGFEIRRGADATVQDWTFGEPVPFGETYLPRPFPTSDVKLSQDVLHVVEMLAENAHDLWAVAKIREGWRYGPTRDDGRKVHDQLVPYSMLTFRDKEANRQTAAETLKLLVGLGYSIRRVAPPRAAKIASMGSAVSVARMGMRMRRNLQNLRFQRSQSSPANTPTSADAAPS